MCEIVAIFVSNVLNFGQFLFPYIYFFCQLIQNVNGSILISTSDITFLLLLTGYFDVVLATKSIMDNFGSGILLNQYNYTDILLTYIQSGKYQLQLKYLNSIK